MKSLLQKILVLFVVSTGIARGDEGMWIPMLVEKMVYDQMATMGMKLSPEQIYSINQSSVKDAIVIFGRGCTGEIISGEGLLLTNHHCGYGVIQSHSTVEADYLTDGFWAMNRNEELPSSGLTVTFLIRIEDVTQDILSQLEENMSAEVRARTISEITSRLTKAATENTHYSAVIRSFFHGNEFYMMVYETFRDVRLVGAPPSSIGKFGADTDNWMWPRHTGDFALFRVYSGPDGKPADYSKDNIPLKPRHFLPVSLAGIKQGDFAFIMGFPGSTDRYLSSWGVEMAIEQSNPAIVKIRDKKLAVMREDMEASDRVRIQYASKYAATSNYWKYYIGQTRGLKRLKVLEKKQRIEHEFGEWIKSDPMASSQYGEALRLISEAYSEIKPNNLLQVYYNEAILRGAEIIGFAGQFTELARLLSEKAPPDKTEKAVNSLKQRAASFYKNYNPPTDQKLLAAMLTLFCTDLPASRLPAVLTDIQKKYKGNFDQYAKMVFEKSVFSSETRLSVFLEKPKLTTLLKDPAYHLAKELSVYGEDISKKLAAPREKLSRGNRLFVAGLRAMQPDKLFYPDANGTMRLTYGQVLDYYPADAVHYNYKTTLKGVMEKEDPDNWEFIVPERLKQLYIRKDYGRYGENGEMITCFISNHDITGGNSGSPVINGRGELIGLAFDGNWEAMSGDIAFEPELQRTISVDIRYVLFIIDKFAGASHLVDEMKIIY